MLNINKILSNLAILTLACGRAAARPVAAPSTDAVDLDACTYVHIKDCYMSVNDDAPENGPWALLRLKMPFTN